MRESAITIVGFFSSLVIPFSEGDAMPRCSNAFHTMSFWSAHTPLLTCVINALSLSHPFVISTSNCGVAKLELYGIVSERWRSSMPNQTSQIGSMNMYTSVVATAAA